MSIIVQLGTNTYGYFVNHRDKEPVYIIRQNSNGWYWIEPAYYSGFSSKPVSINIFANFECPELEKTKAFIDMHHKEPKQTLWEKIKQIFRSK